MEKLKIKEVVVVEGRYDKIKLSSILDAVILVTDGFGIFKDKDKQALIRSLADKTGILTCTDSDGAGLVIRGFLSGLVPPEKIRHILIPPIPGRERRKSAPSKEGTLGVEGMDADLLRELFRPFALSADGEDSPRPTDGAPDSFSPITRADLYADGLMGGPDAASGRLRLMEELNLPRNLSVTALVDAVNLLGGRAVYESALQRMAKSPES